ncbi:MAG: MazG family protein [Actinobacteria bacterium]|nr:MazG family protein [Actinomycetota bacterium]
MPDDPLRALVAVMDRLRSPGGCPWDASQTHESLLPYLLEETYETIEAVETRDSDGLREELGDLLLQVVFHARIAAEAPDGFDIDDVAAGITEKLMRRHPQVFAGARSPTDPDAQWWELKQAEKGRSSVTHGVPAALPSLALATKLRHRSRAGGVSEETAGSEALAVAEAALARLGGDSAALGELLLACVALADDRGWDAEGVARAAARDYRDRLQAAE